MSTSPRLVGFLLALFLCAPLAARAQAPQDQAPQDSDAEADSVELVIARADSARAELVQPEGDKGPTPAYFVRAPFRMIGATIALGVTAGYAVYQLFDELGLIDATMEINRQLKAEDIHASPGMIGSRSWPALEVRWDEPDPFFIEAGASLRGYTLMRAGLALGDTLNGLELAAGRYDQNQLHFWGVGPHTPAATRSDYQLIRREAVLAGWVAPARHLRVRLGGGIEDDVIGRGHDDSRPDAQDVFPVLLTPDRENDRFVHAGAGIDFDLTRVDEEYQLWGGALSADWRIFRGVEDTDARFQVGSADLQLFAPLNRRHAIALRGLVAETWGEEGTGIPFYHLPALGSEEGLRGYRSWRFRDRALAAAMAEWRYRIWYHPGDPAYRLEAMAFVDHGMVAPSLGELRGRDFETTPGLGLRLMGSGLPLIGGYVAFGGDGSPRGGLDFETAF